ncbi:MAG: peptidase C14 [Okeania sp. SIO3I5]|uniref:caspase family protein n=1 Tax=Okeania sp. SIO3I5 TaxID=2607805 RepID=UPI0013BAB804|nr:caspase family protein [Okeania sp. SIO3I5]NEQ38191.1 peptidase C14 [Okeania sp. SIO3I5]
MKNYASIAIGINQYEFLEPLSYAQQDAEALHSFLVNETSFSEEQCLLLSDNTSRPIWQQPTYPTRENILNIIEGFCQKQLQVENFLWYFFSGYGVSYQNQDYLMPIDGNLQDPAATGISIRKLLEDLSKSPVEQVLVVLDMKHGRLPGIDNQLGVQAVEVAKELEIPLLLSCHPNQVSEETSALRLGFFTAALLEGLYSGKCRTLKNLDDFLSHRLPELCAEHGRIKENPLMMVNPTDKMNQIILPEKVQVDSNFAPEKVGVMVESLVGSRATKQVSNSVKTSMTTKTTQTEMVNRSMNNNNNTVISQGNSKSYIKQVEMSENIAQNIQPDKSFLQKLIVGSSLTSLVLLLGVFVTNRSIFLGKKVVDEGNLSTIKTEEDNSSKAILAPLTVVSASEDQSTANISTTEGNRQKQAENKLSANQLILSEAVTALNLVSASNFSQAIIKASKIPQGDPLYPEAQNQIERWSLTIFDIASGRALKKDYDGAINAAKLVPRNITPIYQEAQLAIAEWEPQVAKQKQEVEGFNDALLKSAKEQIKPGQASSYIKAINEVRKIRSGEPKYEEAQKLIAQWSNTIFSIAKVRAKNKNLSEAILAGELVPSGTPAYESAQKALADWKSQKQIEKKR